MLVSNTTVRGSGQTDNNISNIFNHSSTWSMER